MANPASHHKASSRALAVTIRAVLISTGRRSSATVRDDVLPESASGRLCASLRLSGGGAKALILSRNHNGRIAGQNYDGLGEQASANRKLLGELTPDFATTVLSRRNHEKSLLTLCAVYIGHTLDLRRVLFT